MPNSPKGSCQKHWYLTPNEEHNDDGKYTEYLEKGLYRDCDEELWDELKEIVDTKRVVTSLEKESILDAAFYSECLDFTDKTKLERETFRNAWHQAALAKFDGINIVFLDPDNGLLVPSAKGSRRENKFVKPEELKDYYEQGSSVVYYQHKARRKDPFYIDQHEKLLRSFGLDSELGFGLKFIRTSLRYYFFIMQPQHKEIITSAVNEMLAGPWGKYFLYYDPERARVFQ